MGYATNGRTRTAKAGGCSVTLNHSRAPVLDASEILNATIEVLAYLGKGNVDADVIGRFAARLCRAGWVTLSWRFMRGAMDEFVRRPAEDCLAYVAYIAMPVLPREIDAALGRSEGWLSLDPDDKDHQTLVLIFPRGSGYGFDPNYGGEEKAGLSSSASSANLARAAIPSPSPCASSSPIWPWSDVAAALAGWMLCQCAMSSTHRALVKPVRRLSIASA